MTPPRHCVRASSGCCLTTLRCAQINYLATGLTIKLSSPVKSVNYKANSVVVTTNAGTAYTAA